MPEELGAPPTPIIGLAPEMLHESTGLTIHRNPKNKFCVVTLYYYADPAKRTPEWEAEARAGMSDAKWAKEYGIDYTAQFGEKVFPEIAVNRARIVVQEPYPEIDKNAVCWGGFDYGSRNPSSFHVYTMIDGVTYSVWELFEPCKNLVEFARKMLACPYWDRIRYIAMDPTTIRNKTQQRANGGDIVSIETLFIEQGIMKFIPGSQNESTFLATIRDHWKNPEDPTFRIYSCCPNQIREFESAIFVNVSERQASTANQYSEKILDKNNHSLDDCKYFMNSKPAVMNTKIKIPNMMARWLK